MLSQKPVREKNASIEHNLGRVHRMWPAFQSVVFISQPQFFQFRRQDVGLVDRDRFIQRTMYNQCRRIIPCQVMHGRDFCVQIGNLPIFLAAEKLPHEKRLLGERHCQIARPVQIHYCLNPATHSLMASRTFQFLYVRRVSDHHSQMPADRTSKDRYVIRINPMLTPFGTHPMHHAFDVLDRRRKRGLAT